MGGHHKLPMSDLKSILRDMGFEDVLTLQNSGNVILTGERQDLDTLEKSIADQLEKTVGFSVPVMGRPGGVIRDLVEKNPFEDSHDSKNLKCQVTLLGKSGEPPREVPQGMTFLQLGDREIGSIIDRTAVGTLDMMQVLENHLGKNMTTRTWNTLLSINGKMSPFGGG